jgi:probable HAF family extracellular repeat protein
MKINNAGQIAGTTTVFPEGGGAGTSTPFRYTPGVGMEPLDMLGGTYRDIIDMNEAGDVVGRYVVDSKYRAYVYTDEGGMQDLGSLGSGHTYVTDINNQGQVVGSSWNEDNRRRAYLWEDGVMQEIATLGGLRNNAYYVSSTGVVVGDSETEDGTWRAFRYSADGGAESLPAMEGMIRSGATWVTDSGIIVGWWKDEDFRQRGFYYTDEEGMVNIDLGDEAALWATPVAANDAGQIIMEALDETVYDIRAMIYIPGAGAHLLNDLLTIDLGWELDTPSAINDSGQVVAHGFAPVQLGGFRQTSVLLTPVSRGDLNCDGTVDFNDIDAFVQALSDADGYAADRPRCERMLADSNCDGSVNFDDIDAFVACLSGDCGCD